jgi:cysteine synthase
MLQEAEKAGHLEGVHTLVENSSGNTAFSLSVLAPLFGIQKTVAMVPWDIAPGKLDLIRIAGAEPQLKKDAADEPSGIAQAREAGRRAGFFNPAQL